MFERFTDRARRVVTRAQEEARRMNHSYIGTEHILIGLIEEEDGVGAKALESLGIAVDAVRREHHSLVGMGKKPVTRRHIPFTPRAKKALELSLREALRFGHNYIGTEHLLLGLLREEEGLAAQILVKLGASVDAVREKVVELLQVEGVAEAVGGSGFRGVPRRRGARQSAPADTPLCPRCDGEMSHTAAYRIVDVREQDGEGKASVLFLFCSSCGHTIDTVILPGE